MENKENEHGEKKQEATVLDKERIELLCKKYNLTTEQLIFYLIDELEQQQRQKRG